LSSDEELERLKAQRMAELQARQKQVNDQQRAQVEAEAAKQAVLRKLLTTEARQRLSNIKIVRPEFGQQLEMELIQLAQAGKVSIPISDDMLKRLLVQIEEQQKKRDITIRRI